MEQYPIPQFIEAEGKIAFFLTFRQFFYLMGAGGICFVLYYILPTFLFFIVGTLVCVATVVIAFGVVNGTPILNLLLNALGFSVGGKNYTWQKKESLYPFKPIQRTQIKKIEQAPVLQAQTSQLKRTKTILELRAPQRT